MNYLNMPNIFITDKNLLLKSIFNRRFDVFRFYVEYNNDSLSNAEQYTIKVQHTLDKSRLLSSILEKDKKYTVCNAEFLFDYLYKDLDEFNHQLKTNIYQFPCIFAPITSHKDISFMLNEFKIKYDKIDFTIKNNEVIVLFTNYKFMFFFNKNESNNIDVTYLARFYVDKLYSVNQFEKLKIKDVPNFNLKASDFSKYLTPIELNLRYDSAFYETLVKMYIENYINVHPNIFIKNVVDALSDYNTVLTSEYYKNYIKYGNDITTFLMIFICKKLNLNILYNMCLNFIPTQFSCYLDKYQFRLKLNNLDK